MSGHAAPTQVPRGTLPKTSPRWGSGKGRNPHENRMRVELELELILSQMAQKPMLRGEVGARALRVRSDVRGHGQVRLCKALGCGKCGCLKPIRACCVVGSAFFLVASPRGGCAMAPRDSGRCWKQFMMCLEEIQFVAGVHSPPMHDPGRRRNSRPRDGSACARVPVYYLVSSVVVVGVEDRPPLGDLGCARYFYQKS